MKRLVEFPSDTGESILFEVEDVGLAGETRRGLSTSAVVERAQTSFEDALEKARPMASSLVGKLRAIGDAAGNPPDEVQVEFGIVLNAEAGAVLASASAGANYKVTMAAGPTARPHDHHLAVVDRGHHGGVRAAGGTRLPPTGLTHGIPAPPGSSSRPCVRRRPTGHGPDASPVSPLCTSGHQPPQVPQASSRLPGYPRQLLDLWWCNPCSVPTRTLPRPDMSLNGV
jgi:Trypsin-co-occurring domain 1